MSAAATGTDGRLLVERRFFTFAESADGMALDSGARLGPITLAYETLGALNADRSNAILVLHALTGDAHVAGVHTNGDARPGWWDNMVGPGRPIDTNRHFVICSNILGGCAGSTGPSSINPATGRPYGLGFPMVTIRDMVRAQKELVDHLGITRLLAVIGGSVGGMQVLRWCVDYPQMLVAAIPLATTTRHSAQAIAFNEVARQAIMADPAWQGGDYYGSPGPAHGLAVARMIGHVTYLSDEAMREKFGRRLHRSALSFDLTGDFQVDARGIGVDWKVEEIRKIVPMPDVFVYPGDSKAGGALHFARTIVRRAEREAVALAREQDFDAVEIRLADEAL